MRVARIGWHLWPELVQAGMSTAERDAGEIQIEEQLLARDRLEYTLGLLLHDSPEAYMRDKPGPQKTEDDKQIERRVLGAILEAVVQDPETEKRVLDWIASPAGKLPDKLAETQEALLFRNGAADWALPPENRAGLAITRSLIAETLPMFWARSNEDWRIAVMEVLAALRALAGADPWHKPNIPTAVARVTFAICL